MKNTAQESLSLQNEMINKITPKKTYENSELIGIKILNSKENLYENFNKEFVDILLNDSFKYLMNSNSDIAKDTLGLLVNMDGLQNKINAEKGQIDSSKKISFELKFQTPNGEEHKAEFKNFTIGYGNMTKGFNHLLAHSNEINTIKAKNELDRICKIPSDLTLAKLGKNGHDLIKAFENAIPEEISPESNAFLKQFIKKILNEGKDKDREALINYHKQDQLRKQSQKNNLQEQNTKEKVSMSEEEKKQRQAKEIAKKKENKEIAQKEPQKDLTRGK